MSALIIALVVLVLVAIGVVVRLLIAEVSKPAKGTVKIVRKPAGATYRVPASAVAGGVVAGSTVAAGVAAQSATVSPASLTMAGPGAISDGGGGVAVATRPAPAAAPQAPPTPTPTPTPTKKPKRQKKMRMRDVVDKGEGVRITFWRRLRSTISLVILVAILGVGAAALVGGFVVFVAFSLEQAIN